MSAPQIDDIDALCKLAYEGKIVELTDKFEHRTDNLSIDRPDKVLTFFDMGLPLTITLSVFLAIIFNIGLSCILNIF
jgi:hypothetical protein